MIETQFASALRSSDAVIYKQYQQFASVPVLNDFLSKVDQYILVLNENRQIVFSNESFLKDFDFDTIDRILGRRVGEILDCRFAWCVSGCGTSEFCKECGAVQSILKSQKYKSDVLMECVILTKNSKTLELGVISKHLEVDGENFTMFTVTDITPAKETKVLEDIFFHDIANIASGIHSMVQLMNDSRLSDKSKVQNQLQKCSSELLDELHSHQVLKAAERRDLLVNMANENSLMIIDRAVNFVERMQASRGIILYVHHASEDFQVKTDANLINRVLVNMLTNALEASSFSQKVTIGANIKDDEGYFWVHNSAFITHDVQSKIFRQKFSTKRRNSGYGTYSIRLLTEGYLDGRADYESTPEKGTTFRIYLPL